MGVILKGLLSPLRWGPPALVAKKQSPNSVSAGVIYVKPVRGPWECYTSWGENITLPTYLDKKGNLTPGMIAKPCGVSLSNIPAELKLAVQAADVKALAPKQTEFTDGIGQIMRLYLDRDKLRFKYYEGAFWQYGDLDPEGDLLDMMWWTCGQIGKISLDETEATIELSTYDEIANRPVGAKYHILCQIGVEVGDQFGDGACRNQILQDGPLRAAWSVMATVLPGATLQYLDVEFGNVSMAGTAFNQDGLFPYHLPNGDLEFTENAANYLLKTPIRTFQVLGVPTSTTKVRIWPKISLPEVPTTGDQVVVVVGCNRSKQDCDFFGNLPNMQAQDLEGNSDLTRRFKVT